jgi:hypothetical protein
MAPLEQHAIYSLEKLSRAVRILAVHPGNIRDRLRVAADKIVWIPETGLPTYEGVDEDIRWILEELFRCEPRGPEDSRVAATLHRMKSTHASRIAERVLEAMRKLEEHVQANLKFPHDHEA